jgi:hypothetical protein
MNMTLNGKFKTKIWKNAIKRGLVKKSPKLKPIYDGLLGSEKEWFNSNTPRIMWVLKEPIDDFTEIKKQPKGGGWSFHDEIAEADVSGDNYFPLGKNRKSRNTWLNILYVSYGILEGKEKFLKNEFCEADNKQDDLNILKKIAVINMSKMPGPTKTIDSELLQKFPLWEKIVHDQISLYNPTIIIFGGTFEFFKAQLFKKDLKNNNQPVFSSIGRTHQYKSVIYKNEEGVLFIDTYHPHPLGINRSYGVNAILKGVYKMNKRE